LIFYYQTCNYSSFFLILLGSCLHPSPMSQQICSLDEANLYEHPTYKPCAMQLEDKGAVDGCKKGKMDVD